MEIRNDPAGMPRIKLFGGTREQAEKLNIADVLITISHCRAYATAYALALGGPRFRLGEGEDD
jgi:holo-[acyl-carrier protein] synthase